MRTSLTNPPFTDPVFGFVDITRPINISSVHITGAEAQLSTFFDFAFVPDALRHFGLQANYTYIDNPDQLTFVSKHTFNIVGLYEAGPFSTRLTYNKRTQYLDYTQNRGDDFYEQFGRPHGTLDLSANLNFTRNATVFFDATNLTGNPDVYTFSSARAGATRADYVRFLRFTERTFSTGLRFRF